jgi:uncharacterized protein (TIGR00725 family)
MNQLVVISVVGDSSCSSNEAEWAEEVGSGLARAGCILLCGGGGGVMAAACKGAVGAGGLTVGLLRGVDPEEANPHVSVSIPTGLGHGRNLAVALGGRAMIAIGGQFGTLSEIAYALNAGRPVIGLGTWEAQGGDGMGAPIQYASSAREAVELALEAAGAIR